MRISLGKLLVNLLEVVKRANTPLIPQHLVDGPLLYINQIVFPSNGFRAQSC